MKPTKNPADALDASIDALLHREEPENGMEAQAGVSISPEIARVVRDLHALAEATPMRETFMPELEAQLLQDVETPNAASMSTTVPHSSAVNRASSKEGTSAGWRQRVARSWRALAGSSQATQANKTVASPPQTSVARNGRLFSPALVIVGVALVVAFFIVISTLLQARRDVIPVAKAGTGTPTALATSGVPITTAQSSDLAFAAALKPLIKIDANLLDKDNRGSTTIAWNPDSSSVAAASLGNNITIWDAATGKLARTIQTGHKERLTGLAWSPDGTILASRLIDEATWRGLVVLWDVASGKELNSFTEENGLVIGMSWSPDGRTLAWTDGWSIRLWDAASSNLLPKPQPTWPAPIASDYIGQNMVTNLAWSPDGNSLAASQGHVIKLWDPADGKELRAFETTEQNGTVWAMSWSSDGRMLAAATMGQSSTKTSIRAWDVTTGQALKSLVTEGSTRHIAWSPNRNILAYGILGNGVGDSRTAFTLYNPVTGEVLRTIDTFATDVAWSPDGLTLALANGRDGTITLWGVTTGPVVKVTAGAASPTARIARTARPTFAPTAKPPAATPSAVPTQECKPGWAVVNIPDPSAGLSTMNNLQAVAALSPNDVWVVGSTFVGIYATTGNGGLTMHWDGTQWNIVPGGGGDAIVAIATDDVWTIGGPSTLHWDGVRWNEVPIAIPDDSNSVFLNGITATSSSDVWAVGHYVRPNVGEVALIEHWDGARWSVVPIPDIESAVGAKLSQLTAVAAVSPKDIWAMGYFTDGKTRQQTLALHWNGIEWSIVASPNLPGDNYIMEVAAVAANDVWAVGPSYMDVLVPNILILHWDGNKWSIVRAPDAGPGPTIGGIAAVSANDVWMGGSSYNSENGESVTVTLHWDGTEWKAVPSPNSSNSRNIGPNFLTSVAVLPSGDVWAVGAGTNEAGRQEFLVLRYRNAPCPTPIGP